jgi:aerobic carbon-monoxide dehydrogenase small subunit
VPVTISVTVDGKLYHDDGGWGGESLLVMLRDHWGLTAPKNGCEQGECGSCAVLLDGILVNSCLVLAAQADGGVVTTVCGLNGAEGGSGLHPVQRALLAVGAVQCGFCIPGMVVAAVDLLARSPRPGPDEIRRELAGNLCRCTGYQKIVKAISAAAGGGTAS